VTYKPGTRVRVTFDATVTAERPFGAADGRTVVRTDYKNRLYALDPTDEVEVLARELEDGAIYLHPNGTAYKYNKARDYFVAPGLIVPIKITATRDKLVKLVPEVTA
jgi:hypothetical protein